MVQHTILIKIELQRIFWVLHPEVQCIIAVRAVFAHAFLLPAMKKASKMMIGTPGDNSMSFIFSFSFFTVSALCKLQISLLENFDVFFFAMSSSSLTVVFCQLICFSCNLCFF